MVAYQDSESWAWLDTATLAWLGVISIATLILSAILLPVLVVRMPVHYFVVPRPPRARSGLRLAGFVARNIVGAVFVVAGVLMLVLPGQGVLTILIGLTWMDFPGKFRMERWLVCRRGVSAALNWIRKKCGKPPFALPE